MRCGISGCRKKRLNPERFITTTKNLNPFGIAELTPPQADQMSSRIVNYSGTPSSLYLRQPSKGGSSTSTIAQHRF